MEKSIKDCECKNWCHDGMHWAEELLANHHYRCPKFEMSFMEESMRLIREFVAGVDMIKTQTGKIPECLFRPYERALLIDGVTKQLGDKNFYPDQMTFKI